MKKSAAWIDIEELFDLDDTELFARSKAVQCARPSSIKASPLILTGNCLTRPICRHCKWEHFKAIGKDPFILDSSLDEIIENAHVLVQRGIQRAFCATGWMGFSFPTRFLKIIEAVREAEPHLELFGLFGALNKQSHKDLKSAGLNGMLTGIESPNEEVYRSFRPGGDSLKDRLNSLEFAQEAGLVIWTGFLAGLGETRKDLVSGIELIKSYSPQSVSILPFVPFPDTPMAGHTPADLHELARINAVARISIPDTTYFFSDTYGGFDVVYAPRIGLNGFYETGERAEKEDS